MSPRVLLAEDNEQLSRLLQNFLTAQRLEVCAVTSGTEALGKLSSSTFDLLLLDLRLPGLTGVEVLQKLRKSPRFVDFPVIVMSGVYKEDRHVAAVRQMGVKHYLQKPFTREVFLKAIHETLVTVTPERTLFENLVEIYRLKKTGILQVGTASPITFVQGEAYSILTSGRRDFSQFLVARGIVDAQDVTQYLSGDGERLVLIQAGLLSLDEVADESKLFASKLLQDSLELRSGITFTESNPTPELPLFSLNIPCLLYEGIKNHLHRFNPEVFIAKFAAHYPARSTDFYRTANLITMRREDIELLTTINGSTVFADVISSASSRTSAARLCYYLVSLGMLVMSPAPSREPVADFPQKNLFNRPIEEDSEEEMSVGFDDLVEELSDSVDIAVGDEGMAAPLSSSEIGFEQTVQRDGSFIKDKNYYEIFGLTPGTFSFNALKEAYFAKSRQYSPERFMELSGATQTMAQDILAVYASAYNTLSSVVAKERYDEILNANKVGLAGKQDDRLQSRIQFQSGKVFLEMGDFENAEKSLLDAYTLEPDNAMHCAYLAWTIYKNPANRNSRSATEKARALLSKSLQVDKTAEAFSFRGWMLLDEGRDGLAEGEFQKALKLNPNEPHARQALRLMAEKAESQNKGFFKKFFG